MIRVLSKDTIDRIAAGEVVERPASIVKELVENSIDAGATAVTVEIKDGGISFIRVTDNGSGIDCKEVRTAFLRHATGKLSRPEDLLSIHTLGFRGEALSSIAAVTRMEMITKTAEAVTAVRYCVDGGNELCFEEIGAPDGTTVITRDLFFNTLPRKKFLKTAATEGSHIAELIERLALSRPDIAFRFIDAGRQKLQTPGTGKLKETIYSVYGRNIARLVFPVEAEADGIRITGYAAAPEVSRPNRNFEIFFINGRYVRSGILSKAAEDAYEGRLMQHQFPFVVLNLVTDPADTDVNVHPTKMEVRFCRPARVYDLVFAAFQSALQREIFIPSADLQKEAPLERTEAAPQRPVEPFEYNRIHSMVTEGVTEVKESSEAPAWPDTYHAADPGWKRKEAEVIRETDTGQQLSLTEVSEKETVRIVGQVFSSFIIAEVKDRMYLVDQHAAHEKICYERMMKQAESAALLSQMTDPPVIITLSDTEAAALNEHMDDFIRAGYEIESFGGREVAVRAVPDVISNVPGEELLKEMISDWASDVSARTPAGILEKTASMACKAAVKAGMRLSEPEAQALIEELLSLNNPWCCPHGRPTMIEMTRYEIEKKFKRIV